MKNSFLNLKNQVLLFIIIVTNTVLSYEKNLKFVFSSIRHGARAPDNLFENNNDSFGINWKDKAGILLNIGMKQEYIVGMIMKDKYKKAMNLSETDNSLSYRFNVSYINRTQQSFISIYQGMNYDEKEGRKLTKGQIQKAVPAGTLSDSIKTEFVNGNNENVLGIGDGLNIFQGNEVDSKNLLYYSTKICKGMDDYSSSKTVIENLKEFMRKRGDVFKKYVQDYDENNPLKSHQRIYDLWDSYISDYYSDKDMSSIVNDDNQKKEILDDVEYHRSREYIYIFLDENSRKAKIASSIQLKNLVHLIEFRMNNTEYTIENPKIYFSVSHDTQLATMIAFVLQSFTTQQTFDDLYRKMSLIPYSSFMNFELMVDEKGKFTVNIIYNNVNVLEVTVEEFISKAKGFILSEDELNKQCYGEEKQNDLHVNEEKLSVFYVVVDILLLIVLVGLIIYLCYLEKRRVKGNDGLLVLNNSSSV